MTITVDPIEATGTVGPAIVAFPTPPDEWYPPSLDDDTSLHRVRVGVSTLWPYEWLGELLHARVHDGRTANLDGTESCTISVPLDDPTLVLLQTDLETWGEVETGRWDLLNRRLWTIEDGVVTGIYVVRRPVSTSNGEATFSCDGGTRLFDDRTLGRGQSNDLLAGLGHFPGTGDPRDLGWIYNDDGVGLTVTEGTGPRTGRSLAIRGDAPGDSLLYVYRYRIEEETAYNNVLRVAAFMKVPASAREGQTLMDLTVFKADDMDGPYGSMETWWPRPGRANEKAAVVEEDMVFGEWGMDPITASAILPAGPCRGTVYVKVYPQSTTSDLEVAELELFQRDNLSTGVERDLTRHQTILIEDAQNTAKGKTGWGMTTVTGTDCGISEVGTWWREDDQPLTDALDGVSSRAGGPDPVWVDLQWRARSTFRRGAVRDDLTLGPDQIVAFEDWQVNPGGMVSQVRATTEWGSDYWRHASIKTDLDQTDGLLIERVTRAPNGMGLRQIDQWTEGDLQERGQAQETATVWVPLALGWTISVGDTFRCVWIEGRVRFDRLVRVYSRTFHESRRMVSLRVGTDDLGLGRPAKNLDWLRQFGRDRHAIGSGVMQSLGRVTRERKPIAKRYRAPAMDTIVYEDTYTGTSGGEIQDIGDGLWHVSVYASGVSGDGEICTTQIRVGDTYYARNRDIDVGGLGSSVQSSSAAFIVGPATVTVEVLTPSSSGGTYLIVFNRVTPATSEAT